MLAGPLRGMVTCHILSLAIGGLRAPLSLPISGAPAWGMLVALRTMALLLTSQPDLSLGRV